MRYEVNTNISYPNSKENKVKVSVNSITHFCFLTSVLCLPLSANSATTDLDIIVKTAPIVPNGLLVGSPLDVTLSFVDLNPAVPGIAMKTGGTITVNLPKEVVNTGYTIAKPGSADGCMPPVFTECSSGGMLDGWPQSPLLPFADFTYDEANHALTITATANSPDYSLESPGAKLVHLFTFGFINPDQPGDYPVSLEIKPDPVSDDVFVGSSTLSITDEKMPNIAIDSTQSVHIKGPRFQNTMYQSLIPGSTSRNMSSNLWDANHAPIVGASIAMTSSTGGDLLSQDGDVIGALNIDAPNDAKGFYLMSADSFETKTGLAGFPTGRIVTSLKTAPAVAGTYVVTLSLEGGNETVHTLIVK